MMTLNDLERRNCRYFALPYRIWQLWEYCVKIMVWYGMVNVNLYSAVVTKSLRKNVLKQVPYSKVKISLILCVPQHNTAVLFMV